MCLERAGVALFLYDIDKEIILQNFGQFTPSIETVTHEGKTYSVYFMRNALGADVVDVLAANPHPFYIAVDDDNHVIAMEEWPEMMQIPHHTIIGIDENFGFTHGAGGTVYGKIWDGNQISEPPH